jgi:hypothetical protein
MQEFDGYPALAAGALRILVGLGAHVAHQGCQAATQSRARGLVCHRRFSRKVVHARTSRSFVSQSVIRSRGSRGHPGFRVRLRFASAPRDDRVDVRCDMIGVM